MTIANQLEEQDIRIVAECLKATVEGDFFPEWEFESLFGISKDVVRRVSRVWPNIDASDQDASDAIVGSLNNLLGYPHRKEEDWSTYISADPREVRLVLDKLLALGM